jgi:hypothetical protein
MHDVGRKEDSKEAVWLLVCTREAGEKEKMRLGFRRKQPSPVLFGKRRSLAIRCRSTAKGACG